MRPCISIRGVIHPLVRPFVGPSVRWSVTLSSKLMTNGLLRIPNDLDSAGREDRGTRRKEGQRGRNDERVRNDEEEGATRRMKK